MTTMTDNVLQVAPNGRVTLPAKLRKLAGLNGGDLVRAEMQDGKIVLIPLVTLDRDQAYFASSRWQAGERDAQEDLDAGRAKTFASLDEFARDLKQGE